MQRRAYLAAVGAVGLAGLAGCKGDVARGAGRHLLGPDTDRRRVTVADVDAAPDDIGLHIGVDLRESVANTDHPPRLAITTTNRAPERSISIAEGGCSLFNRLKGGSDDPEGLWLYPPGALEPDDRVGRRWVPDRGGRGKALYGCDPATYRAGKSLTNQYEVWDDHRSRGYFRPGTYRWEEEVRVWNEPRASQYDDPDGEFTWGFSLSVEAPD